VQVAVVPVAVVPVALVQKKQSWATLPPAFPPCLSASSVLLSFLPLLLLIFFFCPLALGPPLPLQPTMTCWLAG
jgi:hypothetical protein